MCAALLHCRHICCVMLQTHRYSASSEHSVVLHFTRVVWPFQAAGMIINTCLCVVCSRISLSR